MDDAVIVVIQGVVWKSGRMWLRLRTNVRLSRAVLDVTAKVILESGLFDSKLVTPTRDGIWAYPGKGVLWEDAEAEAVRVLAESILINTGVETISIFRDRYVSSIGEKKT